MKKFLKSRHRPTDTFYNPEGQPILPSEYRTYCEFNYLRHTSALTYERSARYTI